ncbi:hypothetical protein ACLOJK_028636 [Asimina triloba]
MHLCRKLEVKHKLLRSSGIWACSSIKASSNDPRLRGVTEPSRSRGYVATPPLCPMAIGRSNPIMRAGEFGSRKANSISYD